MQHTHFYYVSIFMSFITAVIHIKISKDSSENNGGYSISHANAYFPSFHLHMPLLTAWLQHFKCLVPHGWMWYALCLWYSVFYKMLSARTHTHTHISFIMESVNTILLILNCTFIYLPIFVHTWHRVSCSINHQQYNVILHKCA